MDPLDKYMIAHLYTWGCACGWREAVRLFLKPTVCSRPCPKCHATAYLRDEVIERTVVLRTTG
jgi:hypothetical protein